MTDAAEADRRDRRAAAADAAWAAEKGQASSGNPRSGRAPRRSGGECYRTYYLVFCSDVV